jgi:hypothetical protein
MIPYLSLNDNNYSTYYVVAIRVASIEQTILSLFKHNNSIHHTLYHTFK